MDGILNIYKEKGYTSHDVVAKLRGILHQKKIGHTGTLDPDATGVLPVCVGRATKLCDMLTDHSKTYRAVMLLGVMTDTQDLSGTVLTRAQESDMVHITKDAVCAAIMSYVGTYQQIPPMYSALKVNGKKLYELARAGIEVERKARTVEIEEIRILDVNLPEVTIEVSCSKGTYIRTLCHDIGQKLGVGAAMKELTRTKVDRFLLEDALTLSQVESLRDAGALEQHMISLETMFDALPKLTVDASLDKLLLNGNKFKRTDEYTENTQVRVYDSQGHFTGIYCKQQSEYRPVKMFLGS
ncbi:MAG: tRNA pseudouridine(55) synthase TruB [bacterium]|nr:tRNA pseudouridine(55) synthase TruB [bacterium]